MELILLYLLFLLKANCMKNIIRLPLNMSTSSICFHVSCGMVRQGEHLPEQVRNQIVRPHNDGGTHQ